MRNRVHGGLAVVALVAATFGVGVATAAPAAAAPALVVTPSTGLLEGHVAEAQATGLTPGARYWITQCRPEGQCTFVVDVGGRVYIPSSSSFTQASGSGTITVRLGLKRAGCVPDGCIVGLFPEQPAGETLASAPLTFAAEGTYQWPQATLAATFANPTIEGSTFSAAVEDMSPWHNVVSPHFPSAASVDICRDDGDLTGDDCLRGLDWGANRMDAIALGADGGTAGGGSFRLTRHLPGSWDCAIDGCVLVVTQSGTPDVVGNPRTQAVPITYAPEWAPFPNVDSFIDRAVAGVLGRKPTTAGRARLRAGLPDRSITGVEALVEAAASSRLDADVGEVVRLYRAYFGRRVESAGLSYWVGRLRAGLTPLSMARAFGGTPEFTARYGSLSAAAAVTLTYQTVLGREPSSGELEYWSGRLGSGMTKTDLVYSFGRSPENRSRTNRAVWSTIVMWRLTGFAPTTEQLAGGPSRAAADALALAHP
ncbi:MAG TPA: DUF4214 domain-containing protein [Iamia sp.]